MNHYITGHNLIQPSVDHAPLEMNLTPGDAELLASCYAAVDAIAAKRTKLDEPHGVYNASDIGIDFRDLEVMP